MIRILAGLAAAAVVLVGCASATPSPGTADLQHQADLYAINQIEVIWHQSSSRKDVDLMMSIWAKDATFTTATKTYTGQDQIRQFFATQAAPFKPENHWVSDSPAFKNRVTIDASGLKGTLYFECDYIDIDTRAVKVVVSADQTVAKVNGTWLITSATSATPDLGY